MERPNLNKIIKENLNKDKFQDKSSPSLPTNGWLDAYQAGGIYLSDRAKATQFGQYKRGGGYFPEYHSYAPPRMNMGGDPSIADLNPKVSFYKDGGGWLDKYNKGRVIKDNRGQWAHPGKVTEINSNDITMQGVPYPVLGIGKDGQKIMMQPGQDYTFNKGPVTEYPVAKEGGWLKKYQVAGGVGKPSLILGNPLVKWAGHEPTNEDLVASLVDPSGLSNVPFVTKSIRNMIENPSWGNLADIGWNMLGSIPIIGGKVTAPGKVVKAATVAEEVSKARNIRKAIGRPIAKVVKTADKVITAPARAVDAGWKAIGITPAIGKTIMNANLWNRGQRGYEAGLKGLVEGLNFVSPGEQPAEEKQSAATPVVAKKPVQTNDRYLESGMIEDKNKGVMHVIKNGKVVKTFPIMTGANKNANKNPYSLDYLEKHPEARATPVGTYLSTPNSDIYGQPGFNMKPIPAFGEAAPEAKNLAQHVIYGTGPKGTEGYDPKEGARRTKIMQGLGEQRVGSYGCTNMYGEDINCLTGEMFPQGDTTMVVDTRRAGDLDFLRKKYGIKKAGGQTNNWLDRYK